MNKKIGIIIGVVAGIGMLGFGAWYTVNYGGIFSGGENVISNVASENGTESDGASLKNGENVIKSGGTYEISGNITGRIKIDTTEAVTLVINSDVSITNNDENGAISADGDLTIKGDGKLTISSTGKGIKAEGVLTIDSGTIAITATDDALHSNGSVIVSGGDLMLSSGDDGIHADSDVTIAGGKIDISKSHEGIEGHNITVSGGEISVIADDDGFNVAGGNDESGTGGQDGGMWGKMGMDQVTDGTLAITGGSVYVNAAGDGLDSNGSMKISGGTVYVDGPTNVGNGALDYNGTFEITGGTLIAVGAAGMAQNASSATQPSVLMNLSTTYTGEIVFGEISYSPTKSYSSILISSPELSVGDSYTLSIGGKEVSSITISQNVTGGSGGMMQGGGQMPTQQQQPRQQQR